MTTRLYELKQLLNLYYSGLTTPDDEKRLSELFESIETLPDDLVADRDIIMSVTASYAPEVPESMAGEVARLVDKLERQERLHFAGRRWFAFAGVAASLAIVVSLILFIVNNSSPNPHEITDPQTAFNETARALIMVSESLNKTEAYTVESGQLPAKITFIDDSLFDEEYDEFYTDSLYTEMTDEKI